MLTGKKSSETRSESTLAVTEPYPSVPAFLNCNPKPYFITVVPKASPRGLPTSLPVQLPVVL